MTAPRPLSLACCDYDRTRPLIDGRIAVEGWPLNPVVLSLVEILERAYGGAEFDIVELGLGSYVQNVSAGTCPYIALPAFPQRAFRHRAIYVRTDRIRTPADLTTARIGLIDYGMTAAIVMRGMLRRHYGVDTDAMRWIVGGVEAPLPRQPEHPPGAAVEPAPDGKTLSAMLAGGEIDALFGLSPPSCFRRGAADVGRLFADPRAEEERYFAATGAFPIMHLVAVRRTLAEEPGLAEALFAALARAKDYALSELAMPQAAKVTLPFVVAAHEATVATLGADYWPYGIGKNRAVLEAFLDDAHADGVTAERLRIDDIFHPATLAS